MDAALNLPPSGPSDFRRMMLELLAIDMSFEAATKFMALYFPVTTSTRALQEAIVADSEQAQEFMDQLNLPLYGRVNGPSVAPVQYVHLCTTYRQAVRMCFALRRIKKMTIPTTRPAVAIKINQPALLENDPPTASASVLALESAAVRCAPERANGFIDLAGKRNRRCLFT